MFHGFLPAWAPDRGGACVSATVPTPPLSSSRSIDNADERSHTTNMNYNKVTGWQPIHTPVRQVYGCRTGRSVTALHSNPNIPIIRDLDPHLSNSSTTHIELSLLSTDPTCKDESRPIDPIHPQKSVILPSRESAASLRMSTIHRGRDDRQQGRAQSSFHPGL